MYKYGTEPGTNVQAGTAKKKHITMKKFNIVTGVITFIVAIVGMLFTLMNPDYTVVDYGRGYKNAVDNYRYGYADVPFTTSLNSHSYITQEGRRQYLEVTSRGRVYNMEMPDLAPASMSMCVTADIFPSAFFPQHFSTAVSS
jgi:hypothetical protein